jgi:SET domain-containing protein
MLCVRARAGISKIHGIGLIAQEFVSVGSRIWAFWPGFDIALTVDEFDRLSPAAQEQMLHYGWYDEDVDRLFLSADDDRFMNHSLNPNCRWNGSYAEAVRDIKPGEEITFDYNQLDGTNLLGWPNWREQSDRTNSCTGAASSPDL